jgi:hypothetical protein
MEGRAGSTAEACVPNRAIARILAIEVEQPKGLPKVYIMELTQNRTVTTICSSLIVNMAQNVLQPCKSCIIVNPPLVGSIFIASTQELSPLVESASRLSR